MCVYVLVGGCLFVLSVWVGLYAYILYRIFVKAMTFKNYHNIHVYIIVYTYKYARISYANQTSR